jgi:hypothetical protein
MFEAVGPSVARNWLLDATKNKFVYQGQGEVHDEQYYQFLRNEIKEYDEKVFLFHRLECQALNRDGHRIRCNTL